MSNEPTPTEVAEVVIGDGLTCPVEWMDCGHRCALPLALELARAIKAEIESWPERHADEPATWFRGRIRNHIDPVLLGEVSS